MPRRGTWIRRLTICYALLVICIPARAFEVAGPARIVDGDTLVIGEEIVRLHGIDAPETGQNPWR